MINHIDPNMLSPAERIVWAAGIPREKWHGIFEIVNKGVPLEAIVWLIQKNQFKETLNSIKTMRKEKI